MDSDSLEDIVKCFVEKPVKEWKNNPILANDPNYLERLRAKLNRTKKLNIKEIYKSMTDDKLERVMNKLALCIKTIDKLVISYFAKRREKNKEKKVKAVSAKERKEFLVFLQKQRERKCRIDCDYADDEDITVYDGGDYDVDHDYIDDENLECNF
jgi:hypothetical protein